MNHFKKIHLIGYASGIGGQTSRSADGPLILQQSACMVALNQQGLTVQWEKIIVPDHNGAASKAEQISQECTELAGMVTELVANKQFFTVVGGDHSSAIGTWSGAQNALKDQGPLGLIWIDAHMDSHTVETSPTGNIHGMPVASLLGYGLSILTQISNAGKKLKPEYLCLIGVRSFEAGEAELLKTLKVRIFYMDEVKQRGLDVVLAEALEIVTRGTAGFGVSIDIDSMDPSDAPGTGVAEPDGIAAKDLLSGLKKIANHPQLIGAEIAEFDPYRDKGQKTEKLIPQLIRALVLGN